MQIDPKIKWFNNGEMSLEDFNNLELPRYNIRNYSVSDNYKMDNFYVFPVLDMDKESTTGYYAMCINKEFAQQVKQTLETWQKSQK